MGAVYADAVAGEAEERLLLGVGEGEGFEAAEDNGVVGNDDGGVEGDGFVGDGFGEVDGEEDFV